MHLQGKTSREREDGMRIPIAFTSQTTLEYSGSGIATHLGSSAISRHGGFNQGLFDLALSGTISRIGGHRELDTSAVSQQRTSQAGSEGPIEKEAR
jgi:hypothetical protein